MAGARLAWDHPGGDWLDVQGRPQGAQPFAAATVRQNGEIVSWDLSRMAQRWLDGSAAPGAVMLRAAPIARSGVVSLSSREATDGTSAPSLLLRWDDGRKDRLTPTADTYTACPTHRSLGQEALLRVGDQVNTWLVFAIEPNPGRRIVEATLMATAARVSGRGATLEAYAAALPAGPAAARNDAQAPGLSAAYPADRGLERNPDVLLVESFNDAASVRKLVASDPATAKSLALANPQDGGGFAPIDGGALRVRIFKDSRQALNHQIKLAALNGGVEPDEAYFRYHLRLGSDWDPMVDGGKLPGFAGTYGRGGWGMRRNDGSSGWSARGAFIQVNPDMRASPMRGIGTYAYTATTDDATGVVWGWNRGPTGLVPKNRWVAVEQQLRMNTPGADDGLLRVWIDGRLAFEQTDIRWRTSPDLHIEAVWLNVYHGGIAKADRDLTLYIDNLVIARRPIGPGRFEAR